MKECVVRMNADILVCDKLGNRHCALMLNENVRNGLVSQLEIGLKKRSTDYLRVLVDNTAGKIFMQCAWHDTIQSIAKNILDTRKE